MRLLCHSLYPRESDGHYLASELPTNGIIKFWRIGFGFGSSFGYLAIKTSQLGCHSGVDEDGFEGNTGSIFTSGTEEWAGASDTLLTREPILG